MMARYQVQIVETLTYTLEVDANDVDGAVDAAYESFGETDWKPDGCEAIAELVTNLETGEQRHIA
jgi:hypothetical protein